MTAAAPLSTQSATKLAGLDHLRAAAICMVLMFHYYRLFKHPDWVDNASAFGWSGVDLFFVLSGYLIAGQLFARIAQERPVDLRQFYFKRLMRILPAYLTVLALYFLVPAFREKPGLSPLWKFLSFTQNYGLDRFLYGCFTHAWSLCIEEQFYLALPLLLIAGLHFNMGKKAFCVPVILFIAGFIVRWFAWKNLQQQPFEVGDAHYQNAWFVHIYYTTHTRLDGLLVGISLAALQQFAPKLSRPLAPYGNHLLVVGLIVLAVAWWWASTLFSFSLTVFGFPLVAVAYGFIVLAAASPSSVLYKFKWSFTSWLASLSYALYLSHKGIIHVVQGQFSKLGIAENSNLMMAICILACLLGAWLLHKGVERPFLKLRDRILAKRRVARATQPGWATTTKAA